MALAPIATVQAVKPGLNGKVAFDSNRDGPIGNSEIYVMNNDGSGPTRLTNNSTADADPSWSLDPTASARIAFMSNRDGNNEIYTMNADGSSQSNITNNSAADTGAAWSPDGTKIAFRSTRDASAGELYTMSVDGLFVTRLTDNAFSDVQAAWSPDGAKIAFTSNRDGNFEIYTMNVDGSSVTRLTNIGGTDQMPTWSPDGTKIVFVSDRDGNLEIYSMNVADPSSQTRLTTNTSSEREPVWSPNGNKLALSSNATGDFEIFAANTDGGSQVNLTHNVAGVDSNPDVQTEQAPNTTITSMPANPTNSTSATFDFNSSEAGSTFTCKLDSSAIVNCTSPKTYTGLSDGSHTVEVTATDGANIPDPTPATYTWTIDIAAPQTTITSGPAHSANTTSARFEFTSTEPSSTFQCRLDASDWASCGSPATIDVGSDGGYIYEVRAVDQAGNADPTPASYAWTVDAATPDTVIDSGPAEQTRSVSATLSFHATETDVAFECSLDGEEFTPCTSPEPVSALAPGQHSFKVRATDSAGNVDQTPAARAWVIDRRAPTVSARLGGKASGRGKVKIFSRARLTRLSGTAMDEEGGVRKVKVALRISTHTVDAAQDSCRFISLYTGHRIEHPCKKPYTKVSGTASWSLPLRRRVVDRLRTEEQYVLIVRATDLAGNRKYSRTRFAVVDG